MAIANESLSKRSVGCLRETLVAFSEFRVSFLGTRPRTRLSGPDYRVANKGPFGIMQIS